MHLFQKHARSLNPLQSWSVETKQKGTKGFSFRLPHGHAAPKHVPLSYWKLMEMRNCTLCHATIGIDLGTSNSAVAAVQNGEPFIIPLKGGALTLPSVVQYTQEGLPPLVGSEAAILTNEARPIFEVKRLMGRKFDSITEEESRRFTFGEVENVDGMAHLRVPENGTVISPEEVSSHILKVLIHEAQNFLEEDIDRVVITVPAFFNTLQKAATITAAGMAGVHNVALIQEPIAAALAYGLGQLDEEDTILVLDMGGGTYDISIVESFDGIFEVVSTAGDCFLGGSDFTHLIADWAADQCLQLTGSDPRKELGSNQSLIESSERAKLTLGTRSTANICIQSGTTTHNLNMSLSQFDTLAACLEQRLWAPLEAVGQECKIDWFHRPGTTAKIEESNGKSIDEAFTPSPRRITKVVLAGGSSQLPLVKDLAEQVTGISRKTCPVDPKLCVALGAAIFGAMMEGTIDRIELMDGYYSSGWHDRTSGFQGLIST